MTTDTATAEVLDAAGFNRLAEDLIAERFSAQASVAMAIKMSSGQTRDILLKTQRLVGKPSIDVRYYVETGKKRYI